MSGFLKFQSHVDDLDFGQRTLFDAVGEFDKRVFIFLRVEIRLERWRSGTQHDDGVRHFGAHDRDVTGVVAWRFLLLVRRVLFLVDDDEREVGDGGKYSGARAYHHSRITPLNTMPLLGALAVG